MFEEKNVHKIALGTQHVVALASDSPDLPPMKLDEFVVAQDAPEEVPMEDDAKSVRSRGSKQANGAPVFSQQQQADKPEPIPEVANEKEEEPAMEEVKASEVAEDKKRTLEEF